MTKISPQFFKCLKIILLMVGFCFFQLSFAQEKTSTEAGNWQEVNWTPAGLPAPTDNVTLLHSLIIEKDSVVEINDLYIGQSGGLTINGTLIINGNLETDNNLAYFEMGDSARVIIYGDFLASNKVDVSLSSYLIIYGDFTKKGSDGQGEFQVDNGNIYVFGDVSGWPNFGECGSGENYNGTPSEDGTCDYGTKDDFDNNAGGFPEDLKELLPCLVNYKWTGAADSDWNNPANWSCDSIPAITNNVKIPGGLDIYPVIDPGTNALVKDLNIEDGASLQVNGNWLRIAGNLDNSGTLNVETGSVSFEGTLAQTIPAGSFQNNRLENLRIDNPEGVISEGRIELTGTLKVEADNFDTGNELILISNGTQTALIDGSGTGQISGTVTMQRYLDPAFGYKYFSSPFSGSSVGDFAPFMELSDPDTNFPHFYRYEENRKLNATTFATGWQAYNQPDSLLTIGEGYAVNFGRSTDPALVELSGEVNNGPINRNLENNNREFTKGFHLIGNPYPSPIDWDAASGWTKNNIEDGIYFFTSGVDDPYTGTYTSYVNGVSTADEKASNIIPSMQGFFIKVKDPAIEGDYPVSANLGMTNEVRVIDFSQEFIKTKKKKEQPLIRLKAAYLNEKEADALVLYFSSNASTEFEPDKDAHKIMNTSPVAPNFYSITPSNQKLSINGLPVKAEQRISLGIKTENSGRMYIQFSSLQNMPAGQKVYLMDRQKKIVREVIAGNKYEFQVIKEENNSRFELLFSEKPLLDPAVALGLKFMTFSQGGKVIVQVNLEDHQKGSLRISNMSGQLLENRIVQGNERIEFDNLGNSGIYIVTLDDGKERHSKKLILRK